MHHHPLGGGGERSITTKRTGGYVCANYGDICMITMPRIQIGMLRLPLGYLKWKLNVFKQSVMQHELISCAGYLTGRYTFS